MKDLEHPRVIYVAENTIYIKRSKNPDFSIKFDSRGARFEIMAKPRLVKVRALF